MDHFRFVDTKRDNVLFRALKKFEQRVSERLCVALSSLEIQPDTAGVQ